MHDEHPPQSLSAQASPPDGSGVSNRPKISELISSRYDSPPGEPARKTVIICSAPRTGSYELCRFLLAAGIGVGHEYLHVEFSRQLAERWGLHHPLTDSGLGPYIDALRRRRARGGVFVTKLQYPDFQRRLRNRHGQALFEGAVIVHLFRPDVSAQVASWRRAWTTNVWDYADKAGPQALPPPTNGDLQREAERIRALVGQDAGFRQVFAMLGIHPLFLTTDDLFESPRRAIARIAAALDVPVDKAGLKTAMAASAPYSHPEQETLGGFDFARAFKPMVFGRADPQTTSSDEEQ